jgi:hypothetical protein
MLEAVSLTLGQVLVAPEAQIETVYFPIRSVISTVTQMHEGDSVEVGLTGTKEWDHYRWSSVAELLRI